MIDHRIGRLAVLAAVIGMLAPRIAPAQMTPLGDGRYAEAQAELFGNVQHDMSTPASPFAYFESYLNMLAWNPDPDPEAAGSCSADAFQISQFFPSLIYASGGTSGGWDVYDTPYSAASLCRLRFRLDQCAEFQLDAWLDPGDFPDFPTGYVRLQGPTVATLYQELWDGELHATGRVAPGEYVIEARSAFSVGTGLQYVNGATYSLTWILSPCGTPLIAQQPADAAVPAGATATFIVAPNGPQGPAGATSSSGAGSLTYQWRRNLAPLTDTGRISGATTSTLTIHDASDADTAYYDVVVSDGSVEEPSRLARLQIGGTSAVEGAHAGPQSALALFANGPNPFTSGTSFRYVAARPLRAMVAIYDVTGARIRTLADGVLEGAGTLAWDGRDDDGGRLPAGVYFLRADAGGGHESRRVVLLP